MGRIEKSIELRAPIQRVWHALTDYNEYGEWFQVEIDEPHTLVEFRLEPTQSGTRLTVVESGFDAVPVERRALAMRENEGGWEIQMRNIQTYVRT